MDTTLAAQLIDVIRESLVSYPSQFNIEVNVIGQRVTSHGGTGLQITATGGGPGSTTIGQQVSLDSTQIEIAQRHGQQAMNAQMAALVNVLTNLSGQLASNQPDKTIIQHLYAQLKGSWVPNVITSVVASIIAKMIGC
jgi:hypothetical protein